MRAAFSVEDAQLPGACDFGREDVGPAVAISLDHARFKTSMVRHGGTFGSPRRSARARH